jgi:hypothetical protein
VIELDRPPRPPENDIVERRKPDGTVNLSGRISRI